MGTANFVHLHTHSEFSLLDGACRIDDLVAKAVEFEMPALALTDHGVMYGNIGFYSAAKDAGVKPILGCEVYVASRSRTQREPALDKDQYHLLLLAQNEQGYRNLIKLVSIAFSEGFYYKPRVDRELLAQYSGHLIALTSCLKGEIPVRALRGDMDGAEKALGEHMDIFGSNNVYVELMDNALDDQAVANEALIALARRTGVKLVATNDIHYTTQGEADAHDVLLAIQTGATLDDPNRMRFGSKEFYMKSPEEMARLFEHAPEAIANTLEIAERCNCEFDFGCSKLPNPGVPEGIPPGEYMTAQAREGLAARMGGSIPEAYEKQLDYECEIINQCGFPLYMLIVRDFTDFARRQGMYVGMRGSAAGSIVCYGLGITDVDPIEYGLTFERFLNPERVEVPDVDLDIQDDRRDELIQYVAEKYGRDRVGQIATFGSLKARAAVRDCGRVLGVELAEVDRICKMIPAIPVGVTIDQALEENRDLQAAYEGSDRVRRLIDTARTLEGLNRSVGVHAAGLLISDDPLTDHVPVQHGAKGELVAQMDKNGIKKLGLVKTDFLGLANLTILAETVKNIKRHQGIEIDILSIPLDDAKTFEMLGRGDTSGVFQLEGAGMRRNVVELKPNSVRELAAIVALYRPGPMAHIPRFIRSKFGQEQISYLHPALEPILEETYGVICYQEQVLRIAQAIAGFTLGQADVLRKAMSVKSRAIMDEQRAKFVEGAEASGFDPKIAAGIFDQIEPFAGYAFNKAHAVCYAFVAYRTAYLKANYPVEYYAALLTANMDDKDKLPLYIEDCKRLGVTILPPDVNASGVEFEVEDGAIRFGLGAVKGCGRAVIEGMVEARTKGGPFKDLHDFCERVQDNAATNRATVECLIKVGAFASIHANRAQLVKMLPDAMSAASAKLRDQRNGQSGLFGADSGAVRGFDTTRYSDIPDLPPEEVSAMEKDLVGLYLSGHPLEKYRPLLEKRCSANAATYRDLEHDAGCVIGGMVADVRYHTTRRNEKMAFIKIEDLFGAIPVTLFPSALKNCAQHIQKDSVVFVKGKASHRERIAGDEGDAVVEVEILAESVAPVKPGAESTAQPAAKTTPQSTSQPSAQPAVPPAAEEAAHPGGNGARAVHIKIDGSPNGNLDALKALLEANPGDCPVVLWIHDSGPRRKIATSYKVAAHDQFVSELEGLLGKAVVKVA